MINIFNAGTKIAMLVIFEIVCWVVYCNITKNESRAKYKIKWAALIACFYTLMAILLNNLLHYYEYKFVYKFGSVRLFSFIKEDITYSVELGELRYPMLFLITFALCLVVSYLNNYIDSLFEDEEGIARELEKEAFLTNTIIIGIGVFGAKLINIYRKIQPDLKCVLVYEDDNKNIELSVDHIKVGKEGISTDKILELMRFLQGKEQAFIVSDFSSLTGCKLTKEVSKIAYNLNVFSEVIVTIPFSFEGKEIVKRAGDAINEILQSRVCNSLYIDNKDGILDHSPGEMTSEHAFTHLYDSIYDHIFGGYRMRNGFVLDDKEEQ